MAQGEGRAGQGTATHLFALESEMSHISHGESVGDSADEDDDDDGDGRAVPALGLSGHGNVGRPVPSHVPLPQPRCTDWDCAGRTVTAN